MEQVPLEHELQGLPPAGCVWPSLPFDRVATGENSRVAGVSHLGHMIASPDSLNGRLRPNL